MQWKVLRMHRHTKITKQNTSIGPFVALSVCFIINLLSEAEVAFTALIYQIVDPSGDTSVPKDMEELRLHEV